MLLAHMSGTSAASELLETDGEAVDGVRWSSGVEKAECVSWCLFGISLSPMHSSPSESKRVSKLSLDRWGCWLR